MSTFVTIAEKLLEHGRKEGFIRSTEVTFIPELLLLADETCLKIQRDSSQYCKNKGEEDGALFFLISTVWSAYAGMGAAYFWNKDWHKLSQKGLYETLTAERGYYEMDEFVLDSIGIPFNSEKYKQLHRFLRSISAEAVFLSFSNKNNNTDTVSFSSLMDACKAMYLFGMVYEMNRLGML